MRTSFHPCKIKPETFLQELTDVL